jgi:putative oxidoreductase
MARDAESRTSEIALNLLRIVAALLFAQHGAQKLLGVLGGMGGPGASALFPSLPWVAGVLELVGGAALALGLFTRPVAFVLSGEMAVAYFRSHAPHGFWPILNRGELAALYCFLFLFLAANGGGRFSLDRLFRREPAPTAVPPARA